MLRFFRGQHLRRNVTDVILQPTSRDTILRLYTFFQTWQILSYSHVRVRKPKFVKK